MHLATTAGSGDDRGYFQWSEFMTEWMGRFVLREAASNSSAWAASGVVPHSMASNPASRAIDGKKVTDDTHEFLENYERIVRLIGKSFPNTGIEILLHNLADPAHSLITLENNVTGRHLRDGTTNLLIDLKRRQLLNEDKLNYELTIGARKFKCTTVPIKRKEFGIVGAICINIDANYISDQVLQDRERIATWFQNFLRTDMQLDENILSRDEYAKALKGKRHFRDEAF